MRQIKYILIDDHGTSQANHYTINHNGNIVENIGIRKPVNVINRTIDPDGYNSNSVVILCKELDRPICSAALKDLLVKLRHHFPDAKIFGTSEIGEYFIKVSGEMNRLRFELSELSKDSDPVM
ncbi:MAG: hypothetical protein IKR29_00665 [Bacteroidales bacterium]|nr:hypothetical protein [Bacteroidales bacterium]